ncbi:PIN domain-containing protein [Microbacterium sp. NIBRBAC000506063]|uniref:PIN domain-containing protein n=1 Tax=Microbacterium sp. NIBRBAC000506063 TaxID=2734618 RepID=UPI001BB80083|nr:type II toxin-antitoxin system VapC family toxin [Microbacterium sp. NIBRBAC000506063]QTV80283.1 type II toxin-antitoxin system VapC family toxin [Microbacterium sp. NIBRBAC000506063]
MIGLGSELIGIDTNVVLRAILEDDPVQSPPAAALFRSLSPERLGFITLVTLAEVYWVLSRSVQLPRDECLAIISALVYTETLEFDDGEGVVRALSFAEEGADFADALIEGR